MGEAIVAADEYLDADDLWLVTTLFNPARYRARRRNYAMFRQRIDRSQLRLLTVECAFGDQPFELEPGPDVLQVRARDVMWQKERLLNLAIEGLPRECRKVAWLDCDVLFTDSAWARQTAAALDRFDVVQPFETLIRLPPHSDRFDGEGEVHTGFAAVWSRDPDSVRHGAHPAHGKTGFAWAARREVLDRSLLYDRCVAGGGDSLIAFAFAGARQAACLRRHLGIDPAWIDHMGEWFDKVAEQPLRIGHLPQALLHLWHGSQQRRLSQQRHEELRRRGYDPRHDVRIGSNGCLEWATDKPELHRWIADYFVYRQEDRVSID